MSSLIFALCVGVFAPTVAATQESPRRLSLEATAGGSFGRGGGLRRNRNGIAFDALLAWRAYAERGHGAVVGLGGGMQGSIAGGDDCLIAPGGGCVPDYPLFYSVGLFLGFERTSGHGAARLLVGPAQYQIDGGGRAFGVQARMDLATPSLYHVAFLASLRGGFVPRLGGETYSLGAFGLGLRLQ